MLADSTLRADLELAKQLASIASEIGLHYFERGVPVDTKADGTPVTIADREIEQALLEALTRSRPNDAVLGEELGARGSSARRWLLDPIDGTFNFLSGNTEWGTHIALESDQQLLLGVITRPAAGLSWWASRGSGAFRAGISTVSAATRLHVSTRAELRTSRVSAWAQPSEPVVANLRRHGCWIEPTLDAILRVAEGELDVLIDPTGKPWDHAAALVLVEEAGGRFSDSFGGRRIDLGEGRFSNGLVHEELGAVLAR